MNLSTAEILQNWENVPFTKVNIVDGFWRERLRTFQDVTLKTCLQKCEETGRIANFAKAAKIQDGEFQGIYFDDSDVYKVLEGAAYALMNRRDPQLEAELDRIIDLIAGAQEEDGYLSTYYTLKAPERKWTDMEKHEMYNGGHLIEAAVAHYQATGKTKLLDVACKLADHYDSLFGPGKRHWVEGHEEIELALVKLYRSTGEERYWKLAVWLLEERGRGHGVGAIWDKADWGPEYCQDDVPVKEIQHVKGHAVRAMYLYTAMADVVHVSGDPSYIDALHRVWTHTVERNMYVTGGIGPSRHNEGFTSDYDLPNETAYCETCAAIAMTFWNHRMNLLFGDAKYADVIEREMYNGALAGLSLSGDRFFYVNPLASKGDHHRVEWFSTSCCPTNMARFLPSIGQYLYACSEDGLAVNQYVEGSCELKAGSGGIPVRVSQKTEYPWSGKVQLTIEPERAETFAVRLRIPGWCRSFKLSVNGVTRHSPETLTDKSYITLHRQWTPGDVVTLELEMPVEFVRARAEVSENQGFLAIQRGPVVYCLEQADHPHLAYQSCSISANQPFALHHRPDLLGGVTLLTGRTAEGEACTLIPYYAWDNRQPGFMQVWIKESDEQTLYSF